MEAKNALRTEFRARRNAHVAALDARVKALMFRRPPSPVMAMVPEGATVGIYLAGPAEAPATAYAQVLHEAGHKIALPWFADRSSPMVFREWSSPWVDELLAPGPWKGIVQPAEDAAEVVPEVLFVPLVAFSADGGRLGQGGGHYDRWLEAHPSTLPIGLAWDCQLVEHLPREAHDAPLHAVVTPTRIYGPWERQR
ncbi:MULTISPECIES: 5-formyltetrahydrofolate cyclo-ligase [unclassified Novosphingobium]|uniref:5-formyltetrahydrofolate cyclo-ligase n=1 Tax=unclassified Novosphingobium TaxID=2644732 RepID=UPI0018809629|nr:MULTISPECIES: 5-formyltetrahydrofolate cyclo-ligase [unclassified Novosphingobium]QOV95224.1 5-formyltetrahydrofolate cyclo-ligase [Novosphingobium sp. ES2-1]